MEADAIKNTGAFISYRWRDAAGDDNIAERIYRYLNDRGVDCYLDREKKDSNRVSLQQALCDEIDKRKNFIFLMTVRTVKELILYRDKGESAGVSADSNLDYVYTEITQALENRKSIIPVCIDSGLDRTAFENLTRVFFNRMGRDDNYVNVMYSPEYEQHALAEIFERLDPENTDAEENNEARLEIPSIYWVGNRLTDMPVRENKKSGFPGFKGCIALFGESSAENAIIMCDDVNELRVDHNDPDDKSQDDFIIDSLKKVLEKDKDAKFMFYNPSTVHRLNLIDLYGPDHFLCLNSADILARVNNKKTFREMMEGKIPLLKTIERTRSNCSYDELLRLYRDGEFEDKDSRRIADTAPKADGEEPEFIIQAPLASGGSGTFVLNRNNEQAVRAALDKGARYIVSVYYRRNVPVNIHAIIYDKEIILTPGSVQLMRIVAEENKLLYKGADFFAYKNNIGGNLIDEFKRQARRVALELQKEGYRGVCGIDAIIHDGQVNVLEVNGRFQASTELVNRACLSGGKKTIQEMNLDAFAGREPSETDKKWFYVPYSNYTYSNEGKSYHDEHIFNVASRTGKNRPDFLQELQADGFRPNRKLERTAEAYLFRIVFKRNIASVNDDGEVLINENLVTPDSWLIKKILDGDMLAIKIALLVQGINIDFETSGKLREATNNAADLQIGKMIVNSPTAIRYVEFSPFSLKHSEKYENKYSIFHYDRLIADDVGVFLSDQNQNLRLKNGKSFSEVAYLSTDRLRVHQTNACCFKLRGYDKELNIWGDGCKFCNIRLDEDYDVRDAKILDCKKINADDIREVVQKYVNDRNAAEKKWKAENSSAGKTGEKEHPIWLRHFLIGGQSLECGESGLVDIARALSGFEMPIYIMSLPLQTEIVEQMIKARVYEFAYNIEIFDPACRKKYMPGKSEITVEQYMEALKNTRKLLNVHAPQYAEKTVRSMIIVGLEPRETMLRGIKELVDNRIEPMLSAFRPLPDTALEDMNAPTIRSLYELFFTVSKMLMDSSSKKQQGNNTFRKLGPRCICCQNNTISLPWKSIKYIETITHELGVDNEYLNPDANK